MRKKQNVGCETEEVRREMREKVVSRSGVERAR